MLKVKLFYLSLIVCCAVIVEAQECGNAKFSSELIYGGEYSKRGQWPWLCTLHDIESDEFFCGSTLISNRHVLTAAHCFWSKGSFTALHDITNAYVAAGQHDLRYFENSAQKRKLDDIKIHPDWNFSTENFDADIALLFLQYPVSFTRFVQPICLPNFNSVLIHPHGTVVGWGRSETSSTKDKQDHESLPKQIEVKAVTNEVCFLEYIEFTKISSPRTFCAGWPGRNIGPCHGDSGGGFYYKVGTTWYIQGIVSATVIDKGRCDVSKYSVYTNILRLVDWIKESMRDKVYVAWTDVTINCNFVRNYDGLYGCEVENILIESPNVRIGNIAGVHQDGNSNLEVEYLWIKDSQVTHLPHFDAEVFFPNFKKYLVTNSKLKFVKRDDFAGMPKLETLNLDSNEIEEFPEDALYDLGALVDLFIDANRLKALPTYLLNHAPLFQRFKANNNSIEALNADFFKTNFALKIVSLDNNKLRQIGVNFKPYKNLKKIDLKNNPCIDTYFNDWRKFKSALVVQQEIEATCK